MRGVLAMALAALLAACATGPEAEQPTTSYRLDASRSDPPAASPSFAETTLQVTPPTGSFAASRPRIFYSLAYRSPAHVAQYGESRWVAPPNRMIGRTVASWLAQSRHWQAVVGPDGSAQADYVLELDIRRVLQVFPAPKESEAVLTVQADLKGPQDRLQAQRLFAFRRPIEGTGAQGAADAQTRNLTRLCGELEEWLLEEMGKSSQGPPSP